MNSTTFIKLPLAVLILLVAGVGTAFSQSAIPKSAAFSWALENSADSSETTIRFIPNAGIEVVEWSFSDGRRSGDRDPVLSFGRQGRVMASLTYTVNGQTFKESKPIALWAALRDELTNIPNVFSPNGDSVNDEFTFVAAGSPRFILRIMSRSGALLYEHESDVVRWDGRSEQGNELPEGIYYYIIEDLSNTYAPATGFVYLFRGKK